ncbi:MAG TPA: hypothetical protein VFN09_13390 [Rhodanobacteraceae bacterium]|nr:hypothetical protein [Rhodanobacteraceae bacterium]
MRDLFVAELRRFRICGLAAVLAQFVVLGFLARMVDLAQQPLLVYRVFGAVYAVAGLLLGLYQMGSYRRPNAWLNLLHRPLPAWRIALALCGAGIVWLALAVALPLVIIAALQHGMTARVVDLRHWLLPLAAWQLAAAGYLAGGYAMLANRRWSACGLVFLVWLLLADASGGAALAVQGLALVWLALLVGIAFKPDLAAPPRRAVATLATAVPVQMGAYLLLLLLGFGIEMLWIAQGSHPNNTATPPVGGHNEVERMAPAARLLAALSASRDAQAPLWREQIALSKVYALGVDVPWRLERNALTNHRPMGFEDAQRRVEWIFSHDRMRYEGHDLGTGKRHGELGVGSDDGAFPAPAMAAGTLPGLAEGDAVLIAGNTLYHYLSETAQVWPRLRLPTAELLLATTPVGEALVVQSDHALYLVDNGALAANEALVQPRLRLAIPGRQGDLRNIDLIELVDGYLVSFLFSNQSHELTGVAPYQSTWWWRDDGHATEVAHRALRFDYPAVYRYKAWWPSPALYALRVGAIGLFAAPDPLVATTPPPVPRSMWLLAGLLMLLSALGAGWLLRRAALSWPARAAWVIACGAIGLPALVSLYLLYREPT